MKKSLSHKVINKISRQLLLSKYTRLPQYVVIEYPKSGGSWLAEMLSEYLSIPFPRNKLPTSTKNIIHGHFMNCPDLHNRIHIVRDGRDVMISFYYHCLFVNDLFNEQLVNKMLPRYNFGDKDDIYNNLPIFMEDLFTNKVPFGFNWSEFVEYWSAQQVDTITYEALLNTCFASMESLLIELNTINSTDQELRRLRAVVDKFDFSNQKKNLTEKGTEVSFLRAGKSKQWEQLFSNHSKQVFKHFAGDTLISLGYENDDDW